MASSDTPLAAGPAIVRTIELGAGLAALTAAVAGRDDLVQRARGLAAQTAPLAAEDAEAYAAFLATGAESDRRRTIDLPERMAGLAAETAEVCELAAAAADGPVAGDARVGALLAETAARAATLLVRINRGETAG